MVPDRKWVPHSCLIGRVHCLPQRQNTFVSVPAVPRPTTNPINKVRDQHSCESVHTRSPVPLLHPDNYCYIYRSKWEPRTVVITGWSSSKVVEKEGGTQKKKVSKE